MAVLHNRVSQKELKELLHKEKENRTTISFYQYFPINDLSGFRDELYKNLYALKVFGRIYVAFEGINAQISVPDSYFDLLKGYLFSIDPLKGIRIEEISSVW